MIDKLPNDPLYGELFSSACNKEKGISSLRKCLFKLFRPCLTILRTSVVVRYPCQSKRLGESKAVFVENAFRYSL